MSLLDFSFFFFNQPAPTEIYTLSLHDALPICPTQQVGTVLRKRMGGSRGGTFGCGSRTHARQGRDRKSTRLNSSHGYISYAVFCLKKKKNKKRLRPKTFRSNFPPTSTTC